MHVKRYSLRRSGQTPGVELGGDLDAEQRAVVEAPAGYLLVVAGAGTGKTRALTYRVARLLLNGALPERILLCTFTNRAAREMLRRVEEITNVEPRRLTAGTFHHVANRLLRASADRIGLNPDYSILDRSDAVDLMARVLSERPKAAQARRFPQAGVLVTMLSMAISTGRSVEDLLERDYARFAHSEKDVVGVLEAYRIRKQRLGLLDFDDLLLGWQTLMDEHPLVATELQDRFLHVLVDEYQDVNTLQANLMDAMARGHDSLTVVGDDDQSIYAFRGATVDAMLRFTQRHPGATVLPLETNYRSTPEILNLANASIAQNMLRHPKTLRPVRPSGELPVLVSVQDAYQQAAFVAQRVLELHEDEEIPLRAMAVLFRAHSHSLELQVELSRRQIPYTVRAGLRFFEQAHVKDALSFLRWLANPRDELAGLRVLRLQPGIGSATAFRVLEHLTLTEPTTLPVGLSSCLTASGVTGLARSRLGSLIPFFAALEEAQGPGPALRLVIRGPYRELALDQFANADTRLEDLERLADHAGQWTELGAFLQDLSLMAGMAAEGIRPGELPDDLLTLSTVHQAKGLEWRSVFLIWLTEGHFPAAPALRDPLGEEEERRLFHVALTRARDHLTMCSPLLSDDGGMSRVLMRPSRFITGMTDPSLLERWQVEESPKG